jgi:DNA-binding Lrp family transcriptional regulator
MSRTARRRRDRLHRQLVRAHRRPAVRPANVVVVGTGTLTAMARKRQPPRPFLTEQERIRRIQLVFELRAKGLSQYAIAAELGVSRPRIGQILRGPIPRSGLPRAQRDRRIVELRDQGWSHEQIGIEFDLSEKRVEEILYVNPPRKRDLDAEILALHLSAYPQNAISRVLDISQTTVSRRLRRAVELGVIPLPEPEPEPVMDASKPFALVTWSPIGLTASARYFATRSEADAAKAAVEAVGEPATVVCINNPPSRRRQEWPGVEEILRSGRGVMEHPYPTYRGRTTL